MRVRALGETLCMWCGSKVAKLRWRSSLIVGSGVLCDWCEVKYLRGREPFEKRSACGFCAWHMRVSSCVPMRHKTCFGMISEGE